MGRQLDLHPFFIGLMIVSVDIDTVLTKLRGLMKLPEADRIWLVCQFLFFVLFLAKLFSERPACVCKRKILPKDNAVIFSSLAGCYCLLEARRSCIS